MITSMKYIKIFIFIIQLKNGLKISKVYLKNMHNISIVN